MNTNCAWPQAVTGKPLEGAGSNMCEAHPWFKVAQMKFVFLLILHSIITKGFSIARGLGLWVLQVLCFATCQVRCS